MRSLFFLLPILCILFGCSSPQSNASIEEKELTPNPPRVSPYANFNSVAALDRAEAYEQEYTENYRTGASVAFGRVWADAAMLDTLPNGKTTQFDLYRKEMEDQGKTRDSLDCTLYAQELLRVGLGPDQYQKLDSLHREIWGDREYAGWSVGYLLTQHFGWRAWLFIDTVSAEFNKCTKQFKKDGSYPVWHQPNIPLEAMWTVGSEDERIDSLLANEEFGWGFSEQGIHTWVVNYRDLKECNWAGAPGFKYDIPGAKPLFITTPFERFHDYNSHVVVFPPKKQQEG